MMLPSTIRTRLATASAPRAREVGQMRTSHLIAVDDRAEGLEQRRERVELEDAQEDRVLGEEAALLEHRCRLYRPGDR